MRLTMTKTMKRISLYLLPLLLAVSACEQTPSKPGLKLGKPYVIDGKTYYPEYDPTYDKIGEASWYGPGFHGKYTASGEVYNQNDLTAAHPTLPMPSLVRVTNLTSGKSLIVRINDRGPFKANRIIDLSKKSAQKLGIKGVAQVRVQFLKQETEEYLASLQSGERPIDIASLNTRAARERDKSIIRSTEPAGQIVESTVSRTRAGQIVSDAAPITSVKSDELNTPEKKATASDTPPSGKEEEKAFSSFKPSAGQSTASVTYGEEAPPAPSKEVKLVRLDNALSEARYNALPRQGKKNGLAMTSFNPQTAAGAFYVQAGSFAAEENAYKLSSQLESIAAVAIGKVEMGEKTWWRVRLGPFDNHQTAASVLEKVHAAGITDARVVHL